VPIVGNLTNKNVSNEVAKARN